MATAGKTTDGASVNTGTADRVYLSSAVPGSSGTVTSLTARVWVDSTSTTMKAVIYDATGVGGKAGTLLATGAEVTISSTTEGEVTSTISLAITSGTTYWIGIHIKDPGAANYNISGDGTAGATSRANDTYSDGPAATYSENGTHTGKSDFYMTYTESGGGVTIAAARYYRSQM